MGLKSAVELQVMNVTEIKVEAKHLSSGTRFISVTAIDVEGCKVEFTMFAANGANITLPTAYVNETEAHFE